MLFLTYLQIHWKKQGNWFYHTYFCRFIFVHSIQHWLVPGNTYCLIIIITHVDNARAFNITKIIRWMINSLIIHMILMLSWKNKCFLSWKDTTLPFRLSSNKRVVLIKLFVLTLSWNDTLKRKKIKQLNW